jgi:hypothetical protein
LRVQAVVRLPAARRPARAHDRPRRRDRLILLCPGAFEGFFRDMAQGFAAGMTPEKREVISANYGVTFLQS